MQRQLQSTLKPLEQQSQFICLFCTPKAFGFEIKKKKKKDMRQKFRISDFIFGNLYLETLNKIKHRTFSIGLPNF